MKTSYWQVTCQPFSSGYVKRRVASPKCMSLHDSLSRSSFFSIIWFYWFGWLNLMFLGGSFVAEWTPGFLMLYCHPTHFQDEQPQDILHAIWLRDLKKWNAASSYFDEVTLVTRTLATVSAAKTEMVLEFTISHFKVNFSKWKTSN